MTNERIYKNQCRHAFLLMAHKNPPQLARLIKTLDSPNSDIFLHFDSKMGDIQGISFDSVFSKVDILEDRINVGWGEDSQVRCGLGLLRYAHQAGPYDYYHLMSGQDFLTLPIEDFFSFFEENKGKNFIEIARPDRTDRMKYWHIPARYIRMNSVKKSLAIRGLIARGVDDLSVFIQKLMRINRLGQGVEVKAGAAWFSVNDDFCRYLLDNFELAMKMSKSSRCPDEQIYATLIWNSEYRETVFGLNDGLAPGIRNIDWSRGRPYIFRAEDYDNLVAASSSKLIARKIEENVDQELVDLLFQRVMGLQ